MKTKAVILAGGLGTRLTEETVQKPKPMVEIGGMPIIWHIMKIYASYGVNDFIICAGYKAYLIKEFFANYLLHMSDVSFNLQENSFKILKKCTESWNVTVVDTGISTMTGGRLKRVKEYLDDDSFFFTYGDGVSDVNIDNLLNFHKSAGSLATLTGVRPPGRFGELSIVNDTVLSFKEKPLGDGAWVNGGFFVLEPQVIDLIENDNTSWESKPLETLACNRDLSIFKHNGFWAPMDTMRDKILLNQLWNEGKPPWKSWA